MKSWYTAHGPITEDDLNNIESYIRRGSRSRKEIAKALGWNSPWVRRIDRALRLLKAADRIRYDRFWRAWTVVEGGEK